MKKHNEGYVMIMVLVALVVLSLLCSFVLTNAVRNLHLQKVAAQRMTDKYAAQGQIEKVVAQLETAIGQTSIMEVQLQYAQEDDIITALDTTNTSVLYVTARCGGVRIDCTLTLEGKTGSDGSTVAAYILDQDGDGAYEIANLTKVQYTNYEISTVEEDASNGA